MKSSHIIFSHGQFKELQEAFNHIMAQLNDMEEARTMRMAYYEAVVIKGGPGVGMGIVVQEEPDGANVVQVNFLTKKSASSVSFLTKHTLFFLQIFNSIL